MPQNYLARPAGRREETSPRPLLQAGRGRRARGFMISAIVLAAGTSSRMGSPKPLLTLDGRPLLERVLETVRDAAVDDIVVVLGHEADRVRDGVSFDGAHVVVNPAYIEGMSTSLQAGVRAADPRSDGFLIVLGDQPFVQSATINTLIERRNGSQAKILIPTYGGARGNPVLLDRSLSEDVQSITGDQGCRAIFGHHTRGILEVPVDDPGILVDLDTPEQITRAEEVVRTGRSIEGLVAMTEHDRSHSHPPGGAMRIDILQVAQDLRARNEPFVLATVLPKKGSSSTSWNVPPAARWTSIWNPTCPNRNSSSSATPRLPRRFLRSPTCWTIEPSS